MLMVSLGLFEKKYIFVEKSHKNAFLRYKFQGFFFTINKKTRLNRCTRYY
jgi:hypothetical protein